MRLTFNQFAGRLTAMSASALMMAGCAGGMANYLPKPANTVFSIVSSVQSIDTNGQIQLKAVAASGGAESVAWSVLEGDNDVTIGQGTIDSRGLYVPPPSLSRDQIGVEVQAQLRSDPSLTASYFLRVTPGFLQPLTPENSALAAGGSLQITAQLAEVGGGSVRWALSASRAGNKRLGSAYGAFSQESCQRSPQNYTVCSAVYNAPSTIQPAGREVYVIASVSGENGVTETRQPLHVLLNGSGISSTPLANQLAQTSLVELGSSGSNNNDADISEDRSGGSFIDDCCGGTLGALVRDETGNQYILSNNHVLAESDQASSGDMIVQPGLIDRDCDQNAGRPVAVLRYVVPLATSQTDVDAALAEVNAGSVDPSGAILQLGAPGSGANGSIGAAAPAAGSGEAIAADLFAPGPDPLLVAKSGRTTGLTCSTIDAINLSVEVDYYKDCAETQPYYRKTFFNQIGIGGDGFSDSGDSGALIVDAGNAEPLGLFFAGGTDTHGGGFSVASPIQDVLAALDTEAGRHFSVVGGAEHQVACLNYGSKAAAAPVSEALRRKADAVLHRNATALVNPAAGILEVAAAASLDAPGDPAIVVYVDRAKENVPVPATIGGIRTMVVAADQSSLNNGTAPKSNPMQVGILLPKGVLEAADEVQQSYAKRLMSDPAIFGVGVTQSRDAPNEAALLVLVDMSKTPRSLPAVVGGLRTQYLSLQRFHVTRSKYAGAPHPSSCALKSLARESHSGAFDANRLPLLTLP